MKKHLFGVLPRFCLFVFMLSLFALQMYAQTGRVITGTVTDVTGEPLAGVNVVRR